MIEPDFTGQTCKLALVPAWLSSYRYRAKAYQVLVNGCTGKIAGRYPQSVAKGLGLVTLAAVIAGAVVLDATLTN